MKTARISIIAASILLAGAQLAAAQTTSTTTTTTWTNGQGEAIREYSTTRKTTSINDPSLQPNVGAVLPPTVTLYPLPDTVKVPELTQYSYTIINDHPVVVETTTRKVVHSWE